MCWIEAIRVYEVVSLGVIADRRKDLMLVRTFSVSHSKHDPCSPLL